MTKPIEVKSLKTGIEYSLCYSNNSSSHFIIIWEEEGKEHEISFYNSFSFSDFKPIMDVPLLQWAIESLKQGRENQICVDLSEISTDEKNHITALFQIRIGSTVFRDCRVSLSQEKELFLDDDGIETLNKLNTLRAIERAKSLNKQQEIIDSMMDWILRCR